MKEKGRGKEKEAKGGEGEEEGRGDGSGGKRRREERERRKKRGREGRGKEANPISPSKHPACKNPPEGNTSELSLLNEPYTPTFLFQPGSSRAAHIRETHLAGSEHRAVYRIRRITPKMFNSEGTVPVMGGSYNDGESPR